MNKFENVLMPLFFKKVQKYQKASRNFYCIEEQSFILSIFIFYRALSVLPQMKYYYYFFTLANYKKGDVFKQLHSENEFRKVHFFCEISLEKGRRHFGAMQEHGGRGTEN